MQRRFPQEQCPAQKEFVYHQFFSCSMPQLTALCGRVTNTCTVKGVWGFLGGDVYSFVFCWVFCCCCSGLILAFFFRSNQFQGKMKEWQIGHAGKSPH